MGSKARTHRRIQKRHKIKRLRFRTPEGFLNRMFVEFWKHYIVTRK